VDSRTNIAGSCEWAGITTVELAARDTRTGADYYDEFNCVSYAGVSDIFPESDYSVALYAYAANDVLVTSYTFTQPFPVYPDQTTNIPPISLMVP
jgi:hypothetical protein